MMNLRNQVNALEQKITAIFAEGNKHISYLKDIIKQYQIAQGNQNYFNV
jgi:hypothetical protein